MENGGVKGAWCLDINLLIWEMKAGRASSPGSRHQQINNWWLCSVTCAAPWPRMPSLLASPLRSCLPVVGVLLALAL